jgi:lipoprotein-anchoring transpeptidase ErfK/SrfK
MIRLKLNCALKSLLVFTALLFINSCGVDRTDHSSKLVVSVRDQKLLLVKDGRPIKTYKVSTSKFGLGSRDGSNCTPLGTMRVARKIGDGAPAGMVFKSRRPTGEVLRPNQPGRDPVVSRILWLNGVESQNYNTYRRCIYIHGTPEEWRLGTPASYGCVRMGMKDVCDLYRKVGVGAEVKIVRGPLESTYEGRLYAKMHGNRSESQFLGMR